MDLAIGGTLVAAALGSGAVWKYTRALRLDSEDLRRENGGLYMENEELRLQYQEAIGRQTELETARLALSKTMVEVEETSRLRMVSAVGTTAEGTHAGGMTTLQREGSTFLIKADERAGAEVIKLMENLNEEIMQAAANMAEVLEAETKVGMGGQAHQDELNKAQGRTVEMVGLNMTELLRVSDHYENPILLQIAFQASMVDYVGHMISSWSFRVKDLDGDQTLNKVYSAMRKVETQTVFGRWRQLTRTYLQQITPPEADQVSGVGWALANIVVTAGIEKSTEAAHKRIMGHISNQLTRMMKLSSQLNKTIGEGTTSSDLKISHVAPNVLYNSETMVSDSEQGSLQEHVLCTTDLGLALVERLPGGDEANGESWRESVLLKPRVILPSDIEDIT